MNVVVAKALIFRNQLSVISYQLSVISYQLSVISYQEKNLQDLISKVFIFTSILIAIISVIFRCARNIDGMDGIDLKRLIVATFCFTDN